MKRRNLFTLVLVIIMICCCLFASAQESLLVDYSIPDPIESDRPGDFRGIWKARYMWFDRVVADIGALGEYDSYVVIFDGRGVLASGGLFSALTVSYRDGKATLDDGVNPVEAVLQSDGSLYFETEDGGLFYFRTEPEYETIPYWFLAGDPEKHTGRFARLEGTVLQALTSETDGSGQMVFLADGASSQGIYCFFCKVPEKELLEDEKVTIDVILGGQISYRNVEGDTITRPLAYVLSTARSD